MKYPFQYNFNKIPPVPTSPLAGYQIQSCATYNSIRK